MRLILGLGNPGDKYKNTRHNVAWIVFDNLNKDLEWNFNKYSNANIAHTESDGEDFVFVKPETFMNDSGNVLPYFIKEYGIGHEDIVVVHDDIDLPLGKIKISFDRGDGGHNGIKSIVSVLDSKMFVRIRIGVSIVDENGVLHKPDVLGNFSSSEMENIVKNIAPMVGDAISVIFSKNRESAMTKYNK